MIQSWDDRYDTEGFIYGTKPNEFLKNNYANIPMGSVLCLAEGEGRNAVFLAKQGYRVTAVDNSSVGLKKAKKLAQDNAVSVEFIHCDLATFDLGVMKWDGIVSIFCHVPELIRKELHKQIPKGLKEAGVLLLEAYTPRQLPLGTGGPPSEDLMMSAKLLSDELKDIKYSHLCELERDVTEGTYHSGLGAVVQAIGTRK